MKFYKSFLFLLIINCFFALLIWLVFGIKFLIPAFAFLLILNLFLIFFSYFYFKKQTFSFFTPDDPYKASQTFENLKKMYNIKNVQLLKIKNQGAYSFFGFAKGTKYSIAVSEFFLESFSEEEVKMSLSYMLRMIQTGDLFFFNLVSNFLFLIERMLYYLNYPLFSLTKKPIKKENLFLILFLKVFSFITRKVYKKLDQLFLSQKMEKEKLALLLWKLHSLAKVCPSKTPLFLAPFFIINPLTDSGWDCYISLHPLVKDRLQSLGVNYPP